MPSNKFSYEIEPVNDNEKRIKLVGAILETTDFTPLKDVEAKTIRIDLQEIEYFNSYGVHLWIRFLEALCQTHQVILERCGSFTVKQINMIPNMTVEASVASMMLDYCCDHCDARQSLQLDLPVELEAVQQIYSCPKCQGEMELEGMVEEYQSFIKSYGQQPKACVGR